MKTILFVVIFSLFSGMVFASPSVCPSKNEIMTLIPPLDGRKEGKGTNYKDWNVVVRTGWPKAAENDPNFFSDFYFSGATIGSQNVSCGYIGPPNGGVPPYITAAIKNDNAKPKYPNKWRTNGGDWICDSESTDKEQITPADCEIQYKNDFY